MIRDYLSTNKENKKNEVKSLKIWNDDKLTDENKLKIFEQLPKPDPVVLPQNTLPEKPGSAYLERMKAKERTYKTAEHRWQIIGRWVDDSKKKPSISDDLIMLLSDFKLSDKSSGKDKNTLSRFKGKLKRLAKEDIKGSIGRNVQKYLRAQAVLACLNSR
ncbi:hypothetical protein [Endozoicomonas sp.]|uniref:hypothetical protein n=1 Tax=Endozoicomonas sp. TaxID=1892382 RepID=UPI00383AC36E